jgi:hypothetical protein
MYQKGYPCDNSAFPSSPTARKSTALLPDDCLLSILVLSESRLAQRRLEAVLDRCGSIDAIFEACLSARSRLLAYSIARVFVDAGTHDRTRGQYPPSQ